MRTPLCLLVAIAGAWTGLVVLGNSHASDDLPTLNKKVLRFAKSSMGKKIEDGECAWLAVRALQAAGARSKPTVRVELDYIWGREIKDPKSTRPGDVLQFRDVLLDWEGDILKDGRVVGRGRGIQDFSHHTAIVSEVKEPGKILVVLHQNTGSPGLSDDERRTVKEETLDLSKMKPGGVVHVYRPVAK